MNNNNLYTKVDVLFFNFKDYLGMKVVKKYCSVILKMIGMLLNGCVPQIFEYHSL